MPLILAVEPDKKQAAKLVSLGRGTLKAEVIVAESAHRALQLLDGRVPDLILTSLLLSPRDESVLSDRLRELDAAASHIQTLVIPVLATARRARKQSVGLLKRLTGTKPKDGSPDGCDPEVFAAQIQEYLERASVELERAQAAAERVVSAQHKHLYGDAWQHVEEKRAPETPDDILAADLPEGIDPAFAAPLDDTSWPEPRADFLRSLDDGMRAADQTFASPDVVKSAEDDPVSLIRPEPIESPISAAPVAAESFWADLESPARLSDEPKTYYQATDVADSTHQPYEPLFTSVRTSEEPQPQVDAFSVVRDPASEPISVLRAEPASRPAEQVRETYAPLVSPAQTTSREPLPEVAELDRVISAENEPISVIRPEPVIPPVSAAPVAEDHYGAEFQSIFTPIQTRPEEPVSAHEALELDSDPVSEPISVIRAETTSPWAERVRETYPPLMTPTPTTDPDPLPELAEFDPLMSAVNEPILFLRGEVSEPLSVIRPEAYASSPAEETRAAASLEWHGADSLAIEPQSSEMLTFERGAFAQVDGATAPSFDPAGTSNGTPLEPFGFNVVEDVVPPAPATYEAPPLDFENEWAEVLLRPSALERDHRHPADDTASMARPAASKDLIFDLDTTSAPDFDNFVRELSGSAPEHEPVPPAVAAQQTPEPEPSQNISLFASAPTLVEPEPDRFPTPSLWSQPQPATSAFTLAPAEPAPVPMLTTPAEPEPAAVQAAAAPPAAPPAPAPPQLEVLEMLTAIRRDLEQMKTDRAAIAVQNEPPQITAEAQPERDQAPPEAATLAQAVEPQPRSARQRSRTAPRLKKSTSRRERRPEPPRPKKRKTPAPIQDEWGFFDPDQCGFSALLAKLEEIESDKPPDED